MKSATSLIQRGIEVIIRLHPSTFDKQVKAVFGLPRMRIEILSNEYVIPLLVWWRIAWCNLQPSAHNVLQTDTDLDEIRCL
jgi:hypothetical protein